MTTLRRLGALLVLAAAGAVVGLPAAADSNVPPAACDAIPVKIWVANSTVMVEWNPVKIKAGCHTIEWYYGDGQPLIGMKTNSPFPDKFKHANRKVKTGKANKVGKGFEYWITVPLPDGTSLHLDPDIEVIP
jgi:hypothetical protein